MTISQDPLPPAVSAAPSDELARLQAELAAVRAERDRTQQQLQRYVEDLLLVNRQRRAALDAARQAAAAQSRFLGSVSQELRGPMATVVGFAELLASDPDAPDRGDLAQRIRRAGLQLNTLVDRLLAAARGSATTPQRQAWAEQDLCVLVEAAVHADGAVAASAARGLPLGLELPTTPAHLAIDGDRLAQALAALLEEALEIPSVQALTLAVRAGTAGTAPSIALRVDCAAGAPDPRPDGSIRLAVATALLESIGARLALHARPGSGLEFDIAWVCGDEIEK